MSALPIVSNAICAHQPLPSRSPAAPYVLLVPLAFLNASVDLKSVNFSVVGSNCSTPSGADAQILPLPSTSMVTAPPSGDMFWGVWYTVIFSLLTSSLPRLRRPGLMSNQKSPLASRVSPWAVEAVPAVLFTLRYFTSPVLVSTLPMVTYLLGLLTV